MKKIKLTLNTLANSLLRKNENKINLLYASRGTVIDSPVHP